MAIAAMNTATAIPIMIRREKRFLDMNDVYPSKFPLFVETLRVRARFKGIMRFDSDAAEKCLELAKANSQ